MRHVLAPVAPLEGGIEWSMEISVGRLEAEGGLLAASAVRELSERARAEAALRVSEARFAAFMDNGVAEYPASASDLDALYRTADAALYQAKAAGRDRIIAADSE